MRAEPIWRCRSNLAAQREIGQPYGMPSPSRKSEKKPGLSVYTVKLNPIQIEKLGALGRRFGWLSNEVPHAHFAYRNDAAKFNLVAYQSGKVVIQGKGTEDFVRDILEPEITGEAKLGYDEVHHPEWFEAHAGLDEAGKGDLFGPVIACTVIASEGAIRSWVEAGVKDSKSLSDSSIRRLAARIRKTKGATVETAYCGMAKYNELMARPRANLNKLLAWLHARALSAALVKQEASWGMLDQFSKAPLVQQQLKRDGVRFDLRMQTKAEADPVVAAASICARAEFVQQIDSLGKLVDRELPKGAGPPARVAGEQLAEAQGTEALGQVAKLHFITAKRILESHGKKYPDDYTA